MLDRLRRAKLISPTLAALVALAVLLGLGTWQLQRKQWKEDLLAKIAARVAAGPVSLERALKAAHGGADVEYTHVSVSGRFLHDKERYFYAPEPSGLAWHVYTPLEIAPATVIWVNRGLVPESRKAPSSRPAGQLSGNHEVRGLLRVPRGKTLFTPQNDVAGNLWYWADIPGLTASAFIPGSVTVVPFVLEADAQPVTPAALPKGGVTRIDLPNRHLEYAVTWFGLALTLIAVYLAFAVNRWRALPPA